MHDDPLYRNIMRRVLELSKTTPEKIRKIDIYYGKIKYKKPFVIATSVSIEEEVIILLLEVDDEVFGIGESVLPENKTDKTRVIDKIIEISREIKGMNTYEALSYYFREITQESIYMRVPFSLSLLDIVARSNQLKFGELFGKIKKKKIFTDLTIGIESLDETLQDVKHALDRGFKAIKLKVGKRKKKDLEIIRKVWSMIPNDTALRIDANQGWDLDDALFILKKLEEEDIDIDFMEQPVPKDKISWLKKLKEASSIPIIADESIRNLTDFDKIKENVDGINLKLWKAGDPIEVISLGVKARTHGLIVMIGCSGETNLGITVDTYLASVIPVDFADLDSDILLEDKISKKTLIVNSFRILPSGKGLGFSRDDIPRDFKLIEQI